MVERIIDQLAKVNEVLEEIDFEIDRANKLLNYDKNAESIQDERLRYINVLHRAGKLIEEITRRC
jgi:hypothetical protein